MRRFVASWLFCAYLAAGQGMPASVYSGLAVRSIALRENADQETRIEMDGTGFDSSCVVHIARLTDAREWTYIAAELPTIQISSHLEIRTAILSKGQYIALIRNLEGTISAPVYFRVPAGESYPPTTASYAMPVNPADRWVVTQRPEGLFSHWNRSRNAWDIAPRRGRYVVAMRAGVVHTHDLGLGQTHRVRSFGNYITIDHGDGEYSHYAHLQTGSFLVHEGEHVAQGQSLAAVGNSGYTFGAGGGYHVHVHVTRSPFIGAQSIPFDLARLTALGGV